MSDAPQGTSPRGVEVNVLSRTRPRTRTKPPTSNHKSIMTHALPRGNAAAEDFPATDRPALSLPASPAHRRQAVPEFQHGGIFTVALSAIRPAKVNGAVYSAIDPNDSGMPEPDAEGGEE
jgi:hypothetical protein